MKQNPIMHFNDTTALSPHQRKFFKAPTLISSPMIMLMLAACSSDGSNGPPLLTNSASIGVQLSGDDTEDTLTGGAGGDVLEGGAGDDALDGDAGNDLLEGGAGVDWLVGGMGNDILLGGEGDDTLDGGEDDNILDGGSGNDSFILDTETRDRMSNVKDFQIGSTDGTDIIVINFVGTVNTIQRTTFTDAVTANGAGTLSIGSATITVEQGTGSNSAHTYIKGTSGDNSFTMILEDIDSDDLTASHFEFI